MLLNNSVKFLSRNVLLVQTVTDCGRASTLVNQRYFMWWTNPLCGSASHSNEGEIKSEENQIMKPAEIKSQPVPQYDKADDEAARQAQLEFYKTKHKILKMEDSELQDYRIGHNAIRPEVEITVDDDGRPTPNRTDQLAYIQQDIDLRPSAIRRWWKRSAEDYEIKTQKYNAQRNSILGNDLAAAHFFVFRKGKVKFKGQPNWMTEYRTDAALELDEEDLPDITVDVCNLPTSYDPSFMIEAVDCSDMTELRYEGLANLNGLTYCRSLKFENCIHLDSWCMDRLASMFSNRLLYLDLSGCTGLTEGALCAVARFKNLRTLVVRNLPQIRNKDLVCAWLEDMNPDLEIIGTRYDDKLKELQLENERLAKKALDEEAATITVEAPKDNVPKMF